MPTPKKPWDPRFKNADQERPRLDGLSRQQLVDEHMELFTAYLHALAKLQDSEKMPKHNAWAGETKRIRIRGNAMRDAIDTGELADREREKAAWDLDPMNAPD